MRRLEKLWDRIVDFSVMPLLWALWPFMLLVVFVMKHRLLPFILAGYIMLIAYLFPDRLRVPLAAAVVAASAIGLILFQHRKIGELSRRITELDRRVEALESINAQARVMRARKKFRRSLTASLR